MLFAGLVVFDALFAGVLEDEVLFEVGTVDDFALVVFAGCGGEGHGVCVGAGAWC